MHAHIHTHNCIDHIY